VGSYFAPSYFVGVNTASTVMQEEIFGPVAAVMTFRTPDEAAQLANHTRYGLAATIWSEDINQALDAAARMKAGVVWINSTNLFDAAAGFGGYRESGFGREGGREGLYEYLKPSFEEGLGALPAAGGQKLGAAPAAATGAQGLPSIDRTAKLYIGGKQARPDSGYSYSVYGAKGAAIGQAGLGNRKDIRNAVEAAAKASACSLSAISRSM
jgi:aldehyde dehydrogenase (NAD+)